MRDNYGRDNCDNCAVDCAQCREALSARLDGEDSAAEAGAVDAHLAICVAGC
jgi:predicted anti-sigma-YlaC factor YlaD